MKRREEVQLFNGPITMVGNTGPCLLCTVAADKIVLGDLFECTSCLGFFRGRCANEIAPTLFEAYVHEATFVCPLCAMA